MNLVFMFPVDDTLVVHSNWLKEKQRMKWQTSKICCKFALPYEFTEVHHCHKENVNIYICRQLDGSHELPEAVLVIIRARNHFR